MAVIFYPSCKVKADYKNSSDKLNAYIERKLGIKPAGCCRVDGKKLEKGDTAVVVCNNCAYILEESAESDDIQFVWTIIDNDRDFVFPDYHGEKMTIQDCWKRDDKPEIQHTIRSLMRKMNIDVVELDENFEKCRFCGDMYNKVNPSNLKLAPKHYEDNAHGYMNPLDGAEKLEMLKKHCEEITTDKVVTYCKFCTDGINLGGKEAHHIVTLLFPD